MPALTKVLCTNEAGPSEGRNTAITSICYWQRDQILVYWSAFVSTSGSLVTLTILWSC